MKDLFEVVHRIALFDSLTQFKKRVPMSFTIAALAGFNLQKPKV
jgi:hypothetical protein